MVKSVHIDVQSVQRWPKPPKIAVLGGKRLMWPIGRKMAKIWSKMVENVFFNFFEFFDARTYFSVFLNRWAYFLSIDGYCN